MFKQTTIQAIKDLGIEVVIAAGPTGLYDGKEYVIYTLSCTKDEFFAHLTEKKPKTVALYQQSLNRYRFAILN